MVIISQLLQHNALSNTFSLLFDWCSCSHKITNQISHQFSIGALNICTLFF